MQVLKTFADGDYGIDAMCLMLGWQRTSANRAILRHERGESALKHIANRAPIIMLYQAGELANLLGILILTQRMGRPKLPYPGLGTTPPQQFAS